MKVLELLRENIDLDRAYELFSKSYQEHTGTAWSKSKFMQRASNWTFYGDDNGYVAVRKQYSGPIKLVGVGGSPRSILKGMRELMSRNEPVWGMMSGDLIPMAKKFGMIQPPALVIKLLMKIIPSSVWGDVPVSVNKDGSITFSYSDVGDATKFFIASPEYFEFLLNNLYKNPNVQSLPSLAISQIKNALVNLVGK